MNKVDIVWKNCHCNECNSDEDVEVIEVAHNNLILCKKCRGKLRDLLSDKEDENIMIEGEKFMFKKYIKKPVEVTAIQFTEENKNQVLNWATEIQNNVWHDFENGKPCLRIPILKGEMTCSLGDYLIVEPSPTDWRKLYPCKEEIFKETYQEL